MTIHILMPVYKYVDHRCEKSLKELEEDSPYTIERHSVYGLSCVTQARCAVATLALKSHNLKPKDTVFWVDSDTVLSPGIVISQLELLWAMNRKYGVNALAARVVQRNVMALAAVHDKTRETLELCFPVFAGMAALMVTGEEFMREAGDSPVEYDSSGNIVRNIICCPRVEEGEYGSRLVSEDFDYCSRIKGGVYLAPMPYCYGHVSEQILLPNR